jgi:hypothetical protein
MMAAGCSACCRRRAASSCVECVATSTAAWLACVGSCTGSPGACTLVSGTIGRCCSRKAPGSCRWQGGIASWWRPPCLLQPAPGWPPCSCQTLSHCREAGGTVVSSVLDHRRHEHVRTTCRARYTRKKLRLCNKVCSTWSCRAPWQPCPPQHSWCWL